jgi:hypothetical protein
VRDKKLNGRTERNTLTAFVLLMLVWAAGSYLAAGCGRAKGNQLSAQEVGAPNADVRCYAVLEDGRAVGGNCLGK